MAPVILRLSTAVSPVVEVPTMPTLELLLWNVSAVTGIGLYLYFAVVRKDAFCTKRYPMLTLAQAVGLLLWVNTLILVINADYDNNDPSIKAEYYVAAIVIPLWLTCYILKGFSLICDYFMNRKLLHETSTNTVFNWREHLTPTERVFFFIQQKLLLSRTTRFGQARRYSTRALASALAGVVAFAAFVLLPAGLFAAGCFDPNVGPEKCFTGPYLEYMFYPLWSFTALYALNFPILAALLWKVHDPLYIKRETYATYLILAFDLVGYLTISLLQRVRSGITARKDLLVTSCVVASFATTVFFPVAYCIVNWYKRRDLRRCSLRNDPKSLEKLLGDHILFSDFKQLLAKNFSLENGLFWEDYSHARALNDVEEGSGTKKDKDLSSELEALYTQYVKCGSPRELNISHHSRDRVERDRREQKLAIESFKAVANEVFEAMRTNTMPQFVREFHKLPQKA